MKIAIIGAGAMGCLYGARLSEKNEVYLIDVWKDHMDCINREGLQMEDGVKGPDADGKPEVLHFRKLKGVTDAKEAGTADLAIIFVKSTMTKQAVQSNLAVFGPDTVALTLQNGLGNIDQIAEVVGKDRVIAGTTAHGATMLGPGRMRHAGCGKTVIGEIDGKRSARIEGIAAVLQEAMGDTEISDNVLGLVWDKLLVNVGINALTGITKLYNGQLPEHPEIDELLAAAVLEGKAVADGLGIRLGFADPVAHTRAVCKATAGNKSSMLQDILNGKKTEIGMINGAIVREGRALGIDTPINLALTNIITFLSENS